MPKYIIEREIPGSGGLTSTSLKKIAKKSCDVITEMDGKVQWIESFVTADKWYCVYLAANEQLIKEHAKRGDFPANAINELMAIVDPASGENILSES